MANGFFLGGAAEGISTAQKQALAERELASSAALRGRGLDIQERGQATDAGLRERALGLQERQIKNAEGQQFTGEVDKQIANTMALVSQTIKEGMAVGRDPAVVGKAVAPLVESAQRLAARVGRDPQAIGAQVNAMLTSPTAIEAAAAGGAAKGTAAVAEARVTSAAGLDTTGSWKTLDEKVKAEGSLRDDYIKQSQDFIKIRDAKNRIDTVENTGAGDIALVFQFMKILDPGSTVREGEFATASQAAGVPSQILAQYNKVVGGGVLDKEARKQIKSQAEKLYTSQARQHDQVVNSFVQIAKRHKLDKDNIVLDLSPAGKSANERVREGFGDAAAVSALPPGFVLNKRVQ